MENEANIVQEVQPKDLSKESMFRRDVADSDIRLIGDKMTICQVVQLLAYIRHAIKNNLQTEIKVKIGSKIANSDFMFAVNGLEIPDYITQPEAEIN